VSASSMVVTREIERALDNDVRMLEPIMRRLMNAAEPGLVSRRNVPLRLHCPGRAPSTGSRLCNIGGSVTACGGRYR
jgi:hypothetical protein